MRSEFLPFSVPTIGEDDIDAVVRVLRSGWLTTGPESHAFEKAFAEYVGATHAIAVNSGTAALHLAHRDVTLILFSRAPIDRLVAYKRRMAWGLPWVSTYQTDFPFDFGLALTHEQAREVPEITTMVDSPPEWLQDWGKQVGAKLEDGLRENPSWIAFARENATVYHTYTVSAPDPFVAPYFSFLQERTPKGVDAEPRAWRKDEYPEPIGASR